ncbi:hypothetical protein [Pseudodesulfovibrio sp. zrk46]|uniref:hypothetical protein n=1 Tax=Pseudodesulfovibrio sp. zrk46 TaxID=2725288 RepID=UPI00144A0A53|nr:hypothetical protein [Pseudodesulfovibrio sp. zrk46]QJB58258.1 hypothetical protein HFN16_18535 [Pseudodesulfovibrio sp. zrk46]
MKPMKWIIIVALLAFPFTAMAQDSPQTAEQQLIDLVGKAIVEETTQRSEEVRKAKDILDEVLKTTTATQEEKEEAEKKVEEAEAKYAASQKKLDTARVDAYAKQCGKSRAQIQAMRDSGMGWGRIAKECGIHPSAAGKGKGKNKDKNKNKNKKNKSKYSDDDNDDEDDDGDSEDDEIKEKKQKKNKGKGKKK